MLFIPLALLRFYTLPPQAVGKNEKHAGANDEKYVNQYAWYFRNSGDKNMNEDWGIREIIDDHCRTHPVKQQLPNGLGLYNMSGNILKRCQDWFKGRVL